MSEEKKEEVKEEKKEVKKTSEDKNPQPEEKKEETKEEPKKEEVKEEKPKTVKETEPEEAEEVEVPKKFVKIVEEIETMTVLDLAELVKILEKKLGVSAAMAIPMAVAPTGDNAGAEDESAGKSAFNIELKSAGDKKIEVIKAVRDITGQGLKEAKDIVDGIPHTIKENVPKEEAEEIKKKLEAAGATVELS